MAFPRGVFPGLARYQPLGDWLAAQQGASVTLTFTEIEQILGQPLPTRARVASSWWHTTERRQDPPARVWGAAGWRVAAVDRRHAAVTYVRVDAASEPAL
jgi:hypothetical protein